ncbi:redoxin domain-containing protein [Halorubrum sp. JWXQ-INN 858]|uniref:redoxin domain-containing protein n=1 Tax=Halorubrum sp. JWXQ-INN 858 TaxID=2690782 RepID=UPI00135CD6C5|nr:redoxin domain-containing protein [Halorubrum sp. JWXQ-INN 858]
MTDQPAAEGDGSEPLTLYRLHGCPFCERVVGWLDDHDVSYRSRFVAGEHSRRNEVARLAGTRSVPVLIDPNTGVTMPESAAILEYLAKTYGDGDSVPDLTTLEVVEFPASTHPTVGEPAPDFTRPLVTAESWGDASLSSIASAAGGALLVFYPLNWGGKSMYWWKEIAGRGWGDDADVDVVGIGVSQPFDHQRFIEARDLPYPLFSDPSNGVAAAYDVVHDLDGMAGVAEPRPAVFLVDADLTVEYAWVADEWPETPPYDDIEGAIRDR